MQGSIRFFFGLLICFGAAGASDDAPLLAVVVAASFGLLAMYSGVKAMHENNFY